MSVDSWMNLSNRRMTRWLCKDLPGMRNFAPLISVTQMSKPESPFMKKCTVMLTISWFIPLLVILCHDLRNIFDLQKL